MNDKLAVSKLENGLRRRETTGKEDLTESSPFLAANDNY